MAKRRSDAWEGFEFSDGGNTAICQDCSSKLVAKGRSGTSHVRRHKKRCKGRPDGAAPPPGASNREEATAVLAQPDGAPSPPPTIPAAPPVGASPESSSCSKGANWDEATADLAKMIALHGYDPSFVEDSYFKSFVRRLNPDFQLPSRAAIEDMCDGVCDEANGVLKSELERTSGKVSFAIGTAETALGKVLYAAYHFIDEDWNRRLMIFGIKTVVPEGMSPIPLSVDWDDGINSFEDEMYDTIIERHLSSAWVFSKVIEKFGRDDALQMVLSCFFQNINQDIVDDICWCTNSGYKTTRQERGDFYSQHGLDYLLPIDEPWVSLYFSLQVQKRAKTKDFPSPTRKAEELVRNVLREIYRARKTISDPHRPTSNIVLREWFKVRETLQSSLADASGDEMDVHKEYFDKNVVDILEEAEKILDVSIKDEYLQWSIPLVLDPRYKLQHMQVLFIRAFSSEARDYISNIRKEIKVLFTSFSIDGGETTDADQIHEAENTGAHLLELDLYLEDPRMEDTEDFDILNWWKLNSSTYPTLARMARDVLAIPTSSKLSSEQMSQITSKIRGYTKGKLEY